jgi:hypothetical protein
MNDKYLIIKFLSRTIKDDNLAVYLYCCGQFRSQTTAVNYVMNNLKNIFSSAYSEHYVLIIVKEYLDFKKHQYQNGEINVKPLY